MHAILPERFSKALSWVFGAGLYIVVNCQLHVKLNPLITDEKRNLPILFVTIITQTNLRIYTWLIKLIWSQLYIDWELSQNARLLHFKLSTFKHVYIDLDGEWNLSYQNEQCVDVSNEKFTSATMACLSHFPFSMASQKGTVGYYTPQNVVSLHGLYCSQHTYDVDVMYRRRMTSQMICISNHWNNILCLTLNLIIRLIV